MITCPKCNVGLTAQKDCWNCQGGWIEGVDGDEQCEVCNGSGLSETDYECLDCGHEWEEL